MLDTETKTKIDSARDILVGKVPDPKSQVEQITIALIYKFMDDMDRVSEELGGKASFFTGDFRKYRWAQLLDKRLSGHERLHFYAEGIEKMNLNKNIPQLFRDIFKGVFLPYRDPETLNLFLKEIDGFTYEHSERLGDAFEYLLSVLSTQGDAGQFRTPRHVIDFIVEIVDPKKSDTVLDPACGTAGFLISAYKHIFKGNECLTPDERGRLMTNFRGYDISPDMVRLSRVNLYLHGFPNPVIHEYDTLTSEERWDERCDVILANPPFMSPKGGIRPHNRFSIKAKRSEVLFVDYIAEHLNSGGRAGVIVPEGIIFQSQNAYQALRKMLVENYLWAVVSLPAGVFNPYSGVKTSILFFDRNLAKRTEEVIFVKVENDGFDLGAQRRPIDKNDLPEALIVLEKWKNEIGSPQAPLAKGACPPSGGAEGGGISDQSLAFLLNKKNLAHAVSRKTLLESPDLNLSGDRYRVAAPRSSAKWPMVKIGDLCDLQNGRAFKPTDWEKKEAGGLPIIRIQNLNDSQAEFNFYSGKVDDRLIVRRGDLLFSWSGSRGTSFGPHIWNRTEGILNQHIFNVHHKETVERRFFYWMLKKAVGQVEENLHGGVGLVHITKGNLERIEIPLPPMEEQERIVVELEGYRKVIEGARQVIASYKPAIRIDPKWPFKPMGEVCDVRDGTHDSPKYHLQGFPLITSKNIKNGHIDFSNTDLISKDDLEKINKRSFVADGDILMPMIGTIGNPVIARKDREFAIKNVALIKFRKTSEVDRFFLKNVLESNVFESHLLNQSKGSSQKFVSLAFLRSLMIPLPPLEVQRQIIAELDAERKLIEANIELIKRMEEKIQAKLAEVWGE